MGDSLRIQVRPELREPAMVLAFDGWNDAGEAATSAARYLTDAVQGVPLAEIDPEEFFDFTVRRPEVRLEAGQVRRISWPRYEFRFGSASPELDLVTGLGPEPHLRWSSFCDEVLELVRSVGVRRVALLGAYQADVLYSLPVRITGFASGEELAERFAIEPTGYQGPTGIVGVLGERLRAAGVEMLSLWAGLPHYISVAPNPRGALALLQKLGECLGLRIDEEPLRRAAAEFEDRVAALVASDPTLSEYVKELKRRGFAQ